MNNFWNSILLNIISFAHVLHFTFDKNKEKMISIYK